MCKKLVTTIIILMTLMFYSIGFANQTRGIYISHDTLENTKYINYLIERSKATGINAFVIDFSKMTKRYQNNIELVKSNNIKYIARIVVFPDGADATQMRSLAHREKKLELIKQAVSLGASEIQLDYIRYHSRKTPSPTNARDVLAVIQWFRNHTQALKVPLQIDVFGITSFHEEKRIGQNPGLFADSVDAICPMVYPSHYDPFKYHSERPYETVYTSVEALKQQVKGNPKLRIYPYIEMHNYRYPLSTEQKFHYINAEIKAAEDSNVHGWFAWSANNKYDNLFRVLESRNAKQNVKRINTVGIPKSTAS